VVSPLPIVYADIPVEELKTQYTDAQSQFVEVRGMNVHYRDEGQGPVLILIHGTAASLHTFDDWVRLLMGSYRIIRLDLPGFGLTGPHPERSYEMDAYCTFLEEFVSKLNLQSFFLGGNSLGGRISWNYALRFPARVKKLVLIAASGYPMDINLLVYKLAKIPGMKKVLLRVAPFGGIYVNLTHCFANKDKVTGRMAKRYHQLLLREGNRQALLDRIRVEKTDEYRDIPRINCPTLIMWGDKDRVVSPSLAYRFRDDIRSSELVMYDDVGHIPMEELPEKTANDLAKFLRK